jgi:predicted dehydrogenase
VPVVQWRWGRALRAVKHAIALGLLGSTPTVSIDLAWARDQAYFRTRSAELGWGCSALLSVGIHAVDAVCFALGRRATRVSSVGGAGGASAVLLATFDGGAAAALRITFEGGGPDRTRLAFCGRGVTATIAGGEADPTAGEVLWQCEDAAQARQLARLEESSEGSLHAPLIVPFLGRAIRAHRDGKRPGESDALLAIGDVLASHDVAMRADEAPER